MARKTSCSLTPECEFLLQRLRDRWGLSLSGVIEQAIRRAGEDEAIFLPANLKVGGPGR